MDLKHLSVMLAWLLGLRRPSFDFQTFDPKFRNHTHRFSSHDVALQHAWHLSDVLRGICILNSVSHGNTVCAFWVNWVYLTRVTAPRCHFSQVSLPTCATCSLMGGWKWDRRRDWGCNIDSGRWGHLGQFISAKQIISLPRGKPKTQRWEGMDQIYPCQLKLPH